MLEYRMAFLFEKYIVLRKSLGVVC